MLKVKENEKILIAEKKNHVTYNENSSTLIPDFSSNNGEQKEVGWHVQSAEYN